MRNADAKWGLFWAFMLVVLGIAIGIGIYNFLPDSFRDVIERYTINRDSEGSAGASLAASDTPSPTSTPTPVITLRRQLPIEVYEEFEESFYGSCSEPPLEQLKISQSWSGSSNDQLTFVPPRGTYYLVVNGRPNPFAISAWSFDSVLVSGAKRYQSLHIDSRVPDDLADAQQWCTKGTGVSPPYTLNVGASNLHWTVYLLTTAGTEVPPLSVLDAIRGYYGLCPELPPLAHLEAQVLGASVEGPSQSSLSFIGKRPHYFLGVRFEPTEKDWYFRSIDIQGDWKIAGPTVSSNSEARVDFTAICPTSSNSHRLEVESAGGSWTVYLITVGTK